jgi:hypothetical protein
VRSFSQASVTLLLVPVIWPPLPALTYASPTGAATIRMDVKSTSSSSASSMGNAVYTPCPISERSTRTVIESSGAILSQALSSA